MNPPHFAYQLKEPKVKRWNANLARGSPVTADVCARYHNGVQVTREIKIREAKDAPTLKDETVPKQTELNKIFLSTDARVR